MRSDPAPWLSREFGLSRPSRLLITTDKATRAALGWASLAANLSERQKHEMLCEELLCQADHVASFRLREAGYPDDLINRVLRWACRCRWSPPPSREDRSLRFQWAHELIGRIAEARLAQARSA